MKQLLATLILSTALVFFAGCGDDDDNNVEYYNDLHECMQGEWNSTTNNHLIRVEYDSLYTYFGSTTSAELASRADYIWINDSTISTNAFSQSSTIDSAYFDFIIQCNDTDLQLKNINNGVIGGVVTYDR